MKTSRRQFFGFLGGAAASLAFWRHREVPPSEVAEPLKTMAVLPPSTQTIYPHEESRLRLPDGAVVEIFWERLPTGRLLLTGKVEDHSDAPWSFRYIDSESDLEKCGYAVCAINMEWADHKLRRNLDFRFRKRRPASRDRTLALGPEAARND